MASSTNQPASLSADDMITSSPKQLITSKQLIEPTEKQMISSTGGQLITSSTNQLINSSRNIHKPSLTDHLNKMRQTSKKIETKALSTSLVTQDKLLGMNTNAQVGNSKKIRYHQKETLSVLEIIGHSWTVLFFILSIDGFCFVRF